MTYQNNSGPGMRDRGVGDSAIAAIVIAIVLIVGAAIYAMSGNNSTSGSNSPSGSAPTSTAQGGGAGALQAPEEVLDGKCDSS